MSSIGGAIAASAISSSCYLSALTWPALAPLAALFVSFPGMYIGCQKAPAATTLWLVVTAAIVAAMASPDVAMGFVVPFGVTAYAVVRAHGRSLDFPQVMLVGISVWVGGILAALMLAGGFAVIDTAVQEQIAEALKASADDANSDIVRQHATELASALTAVFPAIITFAGAGVVFLNLMLLRRLTGAFAAAELRNWRSPEGLVWILIASGFVTVLLDGPIRLIGLNVFLVVAGCYFLQGLAVVAFFLDRLRVHPLLRPVVFFFLIVQYLAAICVTLVGLVDLWADLRRLRPRPADPELD